jgi:hypothetical protein
LTNAAALPPLKIGEEFEELDQSRIRTSKMADRSNNSNLILNSKQEFDQIHMENSNLKQSVDAVRDYDINSSSIKDP